MGVEEIIQAFVAKGATSAMLAEFADPLGMRNHPFIGLVLDHLVMMEGLGSPLSPSYYEEFAEEEMDQILATLGTPEPPTSTDLSQPPSTVMVAATVPFEDVITPHPTEAEYGRAFACGMCLSRFRKFVHLANHRTAAHPQQQEVDAAASSPSATPMDVSPPPSPEMVVAAVPMDDSPTPQSLHDDEYSAWSPDTAEFIADFAGGYEPWSPETVVAAVRISDEYRSKTPTEGIIRGKTFACRRCHEKFRKYEDLANHKSLVHAQQMKMDPPCQKGYGDEKPGPYDASSQRGDDQFGPPTPASEEPYEIVQSGQKTFARSAAVETTYKVNFNEEWRGRNLVDLQGYLSQMFGGILARDKQDMDDDDLLRVVIRHEELDHAIVVPLQPARKLDASTITEKVEHVLKSAENLTLDELFRGTYLKNDDSC